MTVRRTTVRMMLLACRRSFTMRHQHWGGFYGPLSMSVQGTIHGRQDKEDEHCGGDHATDDDARQGLLGLGANAGRYGGRADRGRGFA
jgi:hypothetical protein